MERISYSSNLFSHPNKNLEDHLIGVLELSELFFADKPEEIKEKLLPVSKLIAISHDLGKATAFFQKYLFSNENEKVNLKNKPETRHSLLSAICAYCLTKEMFPQESLFPLYAFITVRRHHGNLIDIKDDIIIDDNDEKILKKQLESIDDTKFCILCQKIKFHVGNTEMNKENISKWIENFKSDMSKLKKSLRKSEGSIKDYLNLNLLYSILLDADKSDVVINDISVFKRKYHLKEDIVDVYKKNIEFKNTPLNNLREQAYNEICNYKINIKDRIYSINLPTGLGKTLASFSFALKLKKELTSNHRIIYSLPFLSIIDQNSKVYEDILSVNNIPIDTDILLKHHHLSDIYYKKDDNEFESEQAKILIEGWNSEIIITTFVQFFHTLVSNCNRSLRKFHRLANSIIILDEIQTIPVKYWKLTNMLLKEVSEYLNSYVIFVTATEPLIFERNDTITIVDREKYFKNLDRISLKPSIEQKLKISELREKFNLGEEDKNYLFIFNTINSAKEFFQNIKDINKTKTFLSTHIIPSERLQRINDIKQKKYKIVVSTQLVEAGVDIDFDVVIRDIAPLDAINQSSGRCNRNGLSKGEVYIVSLENDAGKLFSSYIYDPVLLDITKKIISKHKEIREKEFLSLIESYYYETKEKKSQKTSEEIIETIYKLKYDSCDDSLSISSFKLIDDQYSQKDVFIEIDESAKNVWKQFIDLHEIKNVFERRAQFDKIKNEFYKYVISIPMNVTNSKFLQSYENIGYVPLSDIDSYYDKETGFITKNENSAIMW